MKLVSRLKIGTLALLVCSLLFACGGSRANRSLSAVPASPQEIEIVVPCSGSEFFTDSLVFRANAVGESLDMSVAKRKAMSNARAQLAASIQTTVRAVSTAYVNAGEVNNKEQLAERFESVVREVVSQELKGIRLICERYFRTEEGKFKTYVAIELSAAGLVEAYHQRLSARRPGGADVDFELFRESLAHEMRKKEN